MKLAKKELWTILNGGGGIQTPLTHEQKLEVLRRFEHHGYIEGDRFAIAIPDEIDTDHYAVYDRTNGWLSGWDKEEIMNDKGFHFTMEEIETHAVLSKLKVFLMEV